MPTIQNYVLLVFCITTASAKKYDTLHDLLNHSEIALNQIKLPDDYNEPKDLAKNKERFEEKLHHINQILKANLRHQHHRDLHFSKVHISEKNLARLKKNMNIILKNKTKHTIANHSVAENKSMLHKIFKNITDIRVNKQVGHSTNTKRSVYILKLHMHPDIFCFENIQLKFYDHEGKEKKANSNDEKRRILEKNIATAKLIPNKVNACNEDKFNHTRLQILSTPISESDKNNLGRITYIVDEKAYYAATTSSKASITSAEHFKVVLDRIETEKYTIITEYYQAPQDEKVVKTRTLIDILEALLTVLKNLLDTLEILGILKLITFLKTIKEKFKD